MLAFCFWGYVKDLTYSPESPNLEWAKRQNQKCSPKFGSGNTAINEGRSELPSRHMLSETWCTHCTYYNTTSRQETYCFLYTSENIIHVWISGTYFFSTLHITITSATEYNKRTQPITDSAVHDKIHPTLMTRPHDSLFAVWYGLRLRNCLLCISYRLTWDDTVMPIVDLKHVSILSSHRDLSHKCYTTF